MIYHAFNSCGSPSSCCAAIYGFLHACDVNMTSKDFDGIISYDLRMENYLKACHWISAGLNLVI